VVGPFFRRLTGDGRIDACALIVTGPDGVVFPVRNRP
jgi:hypothetical protein